MEFDDQVIYDFEDEPTNAPKNRQTDILSYAYEKDAYKSVFLNVIFFCICHSKTPGSLIGGPVKGHPFQDLRFWKHPILKNITLVLFSCKMLTRIF